MILGDHFSLRSMAVSYVCSGDLCGSKLRNPLLFTKEYTSSDLSSDLSFLDVNHLEKDSDEDIIIALLL